MGQRYTSAATSINKNKLPAVYNKVTFSAPAVLDIGCGKYTEHIRARLTAQGIDYLPYDPYNQPDDVNRQSCVYAEHYVKICHPLAVVCSNVLNVIDNDDAVKALARSIQWWVTRSQGTGYVTVYEGDRTGNGRQTGKDSYQRNEPLRAYLKYFSNARISNGMIIVEA